VLDTVESTDTPLSACTGLVDAVAPPSPGVSVSVTALPASPVPEAGAVVVVVVVLPVAVGLLAWTSLVELADAPFTVEVVASVASSSVVVAV
jgi:hypothetical protein